MSVQSSWCYCLSKRHSREHRRSTANGLYSRLIAAIGISRRAIPESICPPLLNSTASNTMMHVGNERMYSAIRNTLPRNEQQYPPGVPPCPSCQQFQSREFLNSTQNGAPAYYPPMGKPPFPPHLRCRRNEEGLIAAAITAIHPHLSSSILGIGPIHLRTSS
ncbi:hypothetical protein CC78DRAFT_578029 [Lojkania enalia]|uniref:Uncharacterized protein n=1 Tax=Lojkania enalia TaxID=147567 RepID=A0A9P4N7K8_9PLEO|nr:hypothetical protein CC78DRAFT_578029 [Didymosphaeria enalia]